MSSSLRGKILGEGHQFDGRDVFACFEQSVSFVGANDDFASLELEFVAGFFAFEGFANGRIKGNGVTNLPFEGNLAQANRDKIGFFVRCDKATKFDGICRVMDIDAGQGLQLQVDLVALIRHLLEFDLHHRAAGFVFVARGAFGFVAQGCLRRAEGKLRLRQILLEQCLDRGDDVLFSSQEGGNLEWRIEN